MTDVVAFFIIVACGATLFPRGIRIEGAAEAAIALEPLAGRFAKILFAFGLANASLFAASILPLATAYYVCEGLGFEAGVNKSSREAPQFNALYTVMIVLGAGVILIPQVPLFPVLFLSQVAERARPPVRPRLHGPSREPAGPDGRARQRPSLERAVAGEPASS